MRKKLLLTLCSVFLIGGFAAIASNDGGGDITFNGLGTTDPVGRPRSPIFIPIYGTIADDASYVTISFIYSIGNGEITLENLGGSSVSSILFSENDMAVDVTLPEESGEYIIWVRTETGSCYYSVFEI